MAAEAVRLYAGPEKLSARLVIERWRAEGREPLPSVGWVAKCAARAGVLRDRRAGARVHESRRRGRDYEALHRCALELAGDARNSDFGIARLLGVSYHTVRRWVPRDPVRRAAGYQSRAKALRESHRAKELRAIKLRLKNRTYTAIATELKVAKNTLVRWFREAGILGIPTRARAAAARRARR